MLVFIALAPTDLIIKGIRLEYYGYAPITGPLIIPSFLSGALFMGGAAYNLIKRYNVSPNYEERNRLLYLIIALLFPLTGVFLDIFTNLPPASVWGNLAFSILCSIAILKYHLLDVRVIIQKSLVYLFVSIIVAIPYVGIIYFLQLVFEPIRESWVTHVSVILFLAVFLRPIYSWAQQLVDRIFYRDRYDYLQALQRFTHEARSIANFEKQGSDLLKLVRGALKSSSVSLLLLSEDGNSLSLASSIGLKDTPSELVIRSESNLVKWLKLHGRILTARERDVDPTLQNLSVREKKSFEKLKAELCVPVKTQDGELSGVLVLGGKLGQQGYSVEDRRLLSTLTVQMATAIENVRLYKDSVRMRENLQSWLNNMGDCVLIVNRGFTMQFMNRVAIERFGNKIGQICWKSLGKKAICDNCIIKYFPDVSSEGSQYSNHIRDRYYDVVAAPLVDSGGSLSLIEVLRDVTERKETEEKEKELQSELNFTRRLASIGELAAGVAHEINNPLTTVLGFSQRLLRKSNDAIVNRDLERIYGESLRIASVVESLLTFARHHQPKKEWSSINEILLETLKLRLYALKTSNIKVTSDLSPDLPRVVVDFQQIEQVLLNIIVNAEQAMTEANHGGRLHIKTEETIGYVRVLIADNGPGIATEHIERLFNPFYTTRGESGGTGLGLSVCHGIVTKHSGRIYAESELGKGATFIVELPIEQ